MHETTEEHLQQIKECKHRMVFLSPEMADGDAMREIFLDSTFKYRCSGLIVDEAHCVIDMGTEQFRRHYKQIGRLRHLVSTASRVPFEPTRLSLCNTDPSRESPRNVRHHSRFVLHASSVCFGDDETDHSQLWNGSTKHLSRHLAHPA